MPYGYWLLAMTASSSRYHQNVAGAYVDYVYAGKTQSQDVKLSRLVYRDQLRKTTLALKAFRRETSNFIEDTEVENQHRVVGGWEASLNHREFIGDATLDGTLAYKRGTGAFGALPAPDEDFGRSRSRLQLTTAEVSLNAPFSLKLGDEWGTHKLRYSGLVRAQWNATPLTPQDRFAIGGRYSVRGFDGETSLMGDRGWLIRNDLGWALGQSGAELYAGVDYGHIGGQSTVGLPDRHLAGGVMGLRGVLGKVGYDFFVGAPISKPAGYRTARVTTGFNLNLGF